MILLLLGCSAGVATNYDDVEFERTDGRIKRIVIKRRLEGEEFERLAAKPPGP